MHITTEIPFGISIRLFNKINKLKFVKPKFRNTSKYVSQIVLEYRICVAETYFYVKY